MPDTKRALKDISLTATVSPELLKDSPVPVRAYIRQQLEAEIELFYLQEWHDRFYGTGTGEPIGILPNA